MNMTGWWLVRHKSPTVDIVLSPVTDRFLAFQKYINPPLVPNAPFNRAHVCTVPRTSVVASTIYVFAL
jgi:hypothetical protein